MDNNKNTTYTGRADGEAVITLNFGKTLAVTGLKYTVTGGTPIRDYEIQIPAEEGGWQTLATGTFTGGEISTVYFRNENNDPWVCTYDAAQLRLVVKAPAGEISVSELDVLGPTGDNVELLSSGIGTLSAPYVYEESTGQAIPEGSLVFTGSYKGNPAYNVVLLYDENGNVVGGVDAEGSIVAHQIILAPDPQNGQLGEVSEGYWVYWIRTPGPGRHDDAETRAGGTLPRGQRHDQRGPAPDQRYAGGDDARSAAVPDHGQPGGLSTTRRRS